MDSSLTAQPTTRPEQPSAVSSFGESFWQSFKNAAVQQPYDGLSQLVDHVAGHELLPKTQLVEKPGEASTTTAKVGEWVGNTLGSAVPFIALYRVAGSGAASKLELTSKFGLTAESLPIVAKSAAAGAAYGLAFDPVSENGNFWQEKLAAASSTAASMSIMTAGEIGLKSTGVRALQNDALLGVATGLPAGIVGVNLQSLIESGKPSSLTDDLSAGVSMAAVGGLMGGANLLHEHLKPTSGIPGIRGLADLKRDNDASVKVSGDPNPFYHVISEVDSPRNIKDMLDGKIQFLPTESRNIISAGAADLTATHEALKGIGPRAAFFASARLTEDDFEYQRIRRLARQLSEMGYTIVNGGGPGGMEAASRGAFEGGGTAIGVRVNLPFEEAPNKWLDIATIHKDMSTRIEALTKLPDVFVIDRSGWGTDLETMFALQLMQLRHSTVKPLYMTDVEHWKPIDKVFRQQAKNKLIGERDLGFYTITADTDRIARELAAYKPKLDEEYAKRHAENGDLVTEALPRRHLVSRVTGQKGQFNFGDFIAATPEEFSALDVKPAKH